MLVVDIELQPDLDRHIHVSMGLNTIRPISTSHGAPVECTMSVAIYCFPTHTPARHLFGIAIFYTMYTCAAASERSSLLQHKICALSVRAEKTSKRHRKNSQIIQHIIRRGHAARAPPGRARGACETSADLSAGALSRTFLLVCTGPCVARATRDTRPREGELRLLSVLFCLPELLHGPHLNCEYAQEKEQPL